MSILISGKGLVLSVPPDKLIRLVFPLPSAYLTPHVVLEYPPRWARHCDLIAEDCPVSGGSADIPITSCVV